MTTVFEKTRVVPIASTEELKIDLLRAAIQKFCGSDENCTCFHEREINP